MNRRQFIINGVGCGGLAAAASVRFPSSEEGCVIAAPRGTDSLRTPAKEPLRVLSSNPRYFTDGSGKAIYLAGCHTWRDFEDSGLRMMSARDQDPPPVFDFPAYLDFLVAHNHNFFRLWRWEAPNGARINHAVPSSTRSLTLGYGVPRLGERRQTQV